MLYYIILLFYGTTVIYKVVDLNVVMRRIPAQGFAVCPYLLNTRNPFLSGIRHNSNKPLLSSEKR